MTPVKYRAPASWSEPFIWIQDSNGRRFWRYSDGREEESCLAQEYIETMAGFTRVIDELEVEEGL
jgi:hypothetical protein